MTHEPSESMRWEEFCRYADKMLFQSFILNQLNQHRGMQMVQAAISGEITRSMG